MTASRRFRKWVVVKGKKKYGPFSKNDLRSLAGTGWLRKEDCIENEETGKRCKAGKVSDLFVSQASEIQAKAQPPIGRQPKASATNQEPPALPLNAPAAQRLPASRDICDHAHQRDTTPPAEQQVDTKLSMSHEPVQGRGKWVIAALVIAIFVAAGILAKRDPEAIRLASDHAAVRAALIENLHDPWSLNILSIDGPRDTMSGRNVYRIRFRAKNKLGATVLQTTYYQVIEGTGKRITSFDHFGSAALDNEWEWARTGMARYGDQIDPPSLMLGAQVDDEWQKELEVRARRNVVEGLLKKVEIPE